MKRDRVGSNDGGDDDDDNEEEPFHDRSRGILGTDSTCSALKIIPLLPIPDPDYKRSMVVDGDSGESGVMVNEECEETTYGEKRKNDLVKGEESFRSHVIDHNVEGGDFRSKTGVGTPIQAQRSNRCVDTSAHALPDSNFSQSPHSAIIDYGYKTDTNGSIKNVADNQVLNDTSNPVSKTILPLVDKLVKVNSIWYINDISRESVQYLLSINEPGNFIVRGSSKKNCVALSLKQDPGFEPQIEHFLIQVSDDCIKLEESKYTFPDIPYLLAFYIQNFEELPCKLRLPQLIEMTDDPDDLASINVLGKDFWVIRDVLSNPSSRSDKEDKGSAGIKQNLTDPKHTIKMHSTSMGCRTQPTDIGYVISTLENKLGITIDNHPDRRKVVKPDRYDRYPVHRHPDTGSRNAIPPGKTIVDGVVGEGPKVRMRINYDMGIRQEYPLMLHEMRNESRDQRSQMAVSVPKPIQVSAPCADVSRDRMNVTTKGTTVLKPNEDTFAVSGKCRFDEVVKSSCLEDGRCAVKKMSVRGRGQSRDVIRLAGKSSEDGEKSSGEVKVRRKRIKRRSTHGIPPQKNETNNPNCCSSSEEGEPKSPAKFISPDDNENKLNIKVVKECKPFRVRKNVRTKKVLRNLSPESVKAAEFIKSHTNPNIFSPSDVRCQTSDHANHDKNGSFTEIDMVMNRRNNGILSKSYSFSKSSTKLLSNSNLASKSLYGNIEVSTMAKEPVETVTRDGLYGKNRNKSPNISSKSPLVNGETHFMFDKLLQEELDKLEEMGRSCDLSNYESQQKDTASDCASRELIEVIYPKRAILLQPLNLPTVKTGSVEGPRHVATQGDTNNDKKAMDQSLMDLQESTDRLKAMSLAPSTDATRIKKMATAANAKNCLIFNKFCRIFGRGKSTLTSSWEWIPPFKNDGPLITSPTDISPQCTPRAITDNSSTGSSKKKLSFSKPKSHDVKDKKVLHKSLSNVILPPPTKDVTPKLGDGEDVTYGITKLQTGFINKSFKPTAVQQVNRPRNDRPSSNDTVFSSPWDSNAVVRGDHDIPLYYTYPKTKLSLPIKESTTSPKRDMNHKNISNRQGLSDDNCNSQTRAIPDRRTKECDKVDGNATRYSSLKASTIPLPPITSGKDITGVVRHSELMVKDEPLPQVNAKNVHDPIDDVWNKLDHKSSSSRSSSRDSIQLGSQSDDADQDLKKSSKYGREEAKQFWTLRSGATKISTRKIQRSIPCTPKTPSRTSSVIFGMGQRCFGHTLSPGLTHPIWSTLRMRNQSQTITTFLMASSRERDSFLGSTVRNYVKCTEEGLLRDRGNDDPYAVMRNSRQLVTGLKNYFSNVTASARIQTGSKTLPPKNENDTEGVLAELVRLECERLGPNKFLNLDTSLEAVIQRLIIRPLHGKIMGALARVHKVDGSNDDITSCLTHMKQNMTVGTQGSVRESSLPLEFGCEQLCRENTAGLLEALEIYFQKLKATYSPVKKLKNLLKIFNTIKEFLELKESKSCLDHVSRGHGPDVGQYVQPPNDHPFNVSLISHMDTTVPIFIYGLANSMFDTIEHEANYMWALLHPQFKSGVEGFHLVTLLSMIEAMKSIQSLRENKTCQGNNDDAAVGGKLGNNMDEKIENSNKRRISSFLSSRAFSRNRTYNGTRNVDVDKKSLVKIAYSGIKKSDTGNHHPHSTRARISSSTNPKMIRRNDDSIIGKITNNRLTDNRYTLIEQNQVTKGDTNNRLKANLRDFEGFLPIYIPHETDHCIRAYTFPIRSSMVTGEACKMIAYCFNIINSQDYGLYTVSDERESLLNHDSLPCQAIARSHVSSGRVCFIYKRKDAKIAWTTLSLVYPE